MPDVANSEEKKITIGSKKKIAFVCSGGATKAGAFHLGVALALQDQGFCFSGGIGNQLSPKPMEISSYVGSSAGSIISSYLASGYSLDNILLSFLNQEHSDPEELVPHVLPRLTYPKIFKLNAQLGIEQLTHIKQLRRNLSSILQGQWESFLHFKWLPINGFFSTSGIEEYLREEVLFSNRFQDYLPDLHIVATALDTSKKVIFSRYDRSSSESNCEFQNHVSISQACAASTALPFIFSPYLIKNKNNDPIYYIDGEVRDALSTQVAIEGGADLVIASYTHQPYHSFTESESLFHRGMLATIIQTIYLSIEQKINTHIFYKKCHQKAIASIFNYCEKNNIDPSHTKKICDLLEENLHIKKNVDVIYIHPDPQDQSIFFEDHFSLSPKKMSFIVKSGFQSAIRALKKYHFSDRKEKPALGSSG
jgi:predicted acylesterase/phospholipase RssA